MIKLLPISAICLCLVLSISTNAQIPKTALYKFDYKIENNDVILSSPQYLTEFNKGSYNNQPFIHEDDAYYISSQKIGEDQTDILILNINKQEVNSFTATSTAEYSPKIIGKYLYCIRVLPENDQYLWQYPINGSNSGEPAIQQLTNVGYFEFLNESEIALFLVGTPHRLVIYDKGSENENLITDKPGRAFFKSKDKQLLFVEKFSDEFWYIKKYDPKSLRSKIITQTPLNKEDFIMLQEDILLIGSGSKLYKFNPKTDGEWKLVADLSTSGISDISRLAAKNGVLLLVDTEQ